MKIGSYKLLFRIFSYLSDKTNGANFFVKYKLMLGTILIGLTGSAASAKAQNSNPAAPLNDTIIKINPRVTCYKVAVAPIRQPGKPFLIDGHVIDSNGERLQGTTIQIKHSTKGVVTDVDGSFKLEVTPNDILIFSFIGFKTREIPVSNLNNYGNRIIMEDEENILCYEPVITKYKPRKIKKLHYKNVHILPISPVGDRDEFIKWMEENVQYNERMLNEKTEGQLLLNFTIDKKGNIKDAKVISKLSPDADAEALRVLSTSGKWQPGIYNDKPLETVITIPVRFVLPETN